MQGALTDVPSPQDTRAPARLAVRALATRPSHLTALAQLHTPPAAVSYRVPAGHATYCEPPEKHQAPPVQLSAVSWYLPGARLRHRHVARAEPGAMPAQGSVPPGGVMGGDGDGVPGRGDGLGVGLGVGVTGPVPMRMSAQLRKISAHVSAAQGQKEQGVRR
jgi:hypothetical protein